MNPRLRCLIGWILLALAVGCGGGSSRRIVIAPEYQPEFAVVFDDLLAPELFGFDPEGRNPVKDPKLRERILRSDLIQTVKVETLSRVGGVENKGAYEVTLVPFGPALSGTTPTQPLILNVGANSPTYPWVEGAGARWVGTKLILFAKRFRTKKGGKPGEGDVIHYRGEPDTPAMREAINRHLALRMLRK
jgi:hypothetical protein